MADCVDYIRHYFFFVSGSGYFHIYIHLKFKHTVLGPTLSTQGIRLVITCKRDECVVVFNYIKNKYILNINNNIAMKAK